jgi:hypothetical protein
VNDAAMSLPQISSLASYAYATFCLLNALPFIGIPFPRRATVEYYKGKNAWIAKLSGGWLTVEQAGVLGAAFRTLNGLAVLYRPTRLLAHGSVGMGIAYGTYLANRDGRPMIPQFGMLAAIWGCFALELAARR